MKIYLSSSIASAAPVLALARKHPHTALDDADVNIEVLAQTNKSNARLSLRHIRASEEGESSSASVDKEAELKHTAPQHRRFLTHSPLIGSGSPSQRAKVAANLQLHRAAALAHKYQLEQLGFVDDEVGERAITTQKGMDAIVGAASSNYLNRQDFYQ